MYHQRSRPHCRNPHLVRPVVRPDHALMLLQEIECPVQAHAIAQGFQAVFGHAPHAVVTQEGNGYAVWAVNGEGDSHNPAELLLQAFGALCLMVASDSIPAPV